MKAQLGRFSGYLGASILNRAVPFLLLPVLTRYLTPEEFGIAAIYQVLVLFGVAIVGMGMQVHVPRNFFRVEREELGLILWNAVLVLAANTAVALLVIGILQVLQISIEPIPVAWLWTVPVVASADTLATVCLMLLRQEKNVRGHAALELSRTGLNVTVTLVAVVGFLMGWQGRALGVAIAALVFGPIALLFMHRRGYLVRRVDRAQIRSVLRISLPLMPSSLAAAIITLSDRLFLERIEDASAVGVYAVANAIGLIVALFTDAFYKAWSPWVYEQLANITPDKRKRIVRATYAYLGGVVLVTVGVSLFGPWLIRLMTGDAFHGGDVIVPWIASAYAVRGCYAAMSPYLMHEGKTGFLGIITPTAAVANLIGNYLLISHNGAIGAAQATLIAYAIMAVGIGWRANQVFPMPWLSFSTRKAA